MAKTGLMISLLLLLGSITGCNGSGAKFNQHQPLKGEMMQITAQELLQRRAAKDPMLLLDVRQPEELSGRLAALPGIIHIPLAELQKRYHELPAEEEIVVICRSGARSAQACQFLMKQGFKKVINLQGGMMAVRQLAPNN
jgi:rhodanese-related sulfurtransferase